MVMCKPCFLFVKWGLTTLLNKDIVMSLFCSSQIKHSEHGDESQQVFKCFVVTQNHLCLVSEDAVHRDTHTLTRVLSLQFCTELNQPILPNIRKWKGPRGCWRSIVAEKPSSQLQKVHLSDNCLHEFCS